jgi:hypothetical protein
LKKTRIPSPAKGLERSAIVRDELADRLVVRAEHLEQLFGRSRFGERRETAQIGEQTADVGAMSREQLFALLRGDELGDLRREEALQLGALPLHGVEQPCVRDRDGRLIGERLGELDLLVGEPGTLRPTLTTPMNSLSRITGTPSGARCTASPASAVRPTLDGFVDAIS